MSAVIKLAAKVEKSKDLPEPERLFLKRHEENMNLVEHVL